MFSVNKEENELLEFYCPVHGHLMHYKFRKENEELKVYQDLNNDKSEIVNKCYLCLAEGIKKSNEEKEKIRILVNGKYKTKHLFWGLFSLLSLAITFFGAIGFFVSAEYFVLAIHILTFFFFYKFGSYMIERIRESENKEFDQLTKNFPKYSNAKDYVASLNREVQEVQRKVKIEGMADRSNQKSNIPKSTRTFASLEIVDTMTGEGFEYFIKNILIAKDYKQVTVTKASADNGIDIIAYKNNKKIGFQCKRYQSKISNKAIQEVYSGKDFYECDEAYVVTNSHFTDNAKVIAKKLNVRLVDRYELAKWIAEVNQK